MFPPETRNRLTSSRFSLTLDQPPKGWASRSSETIAKQRVFTYFAAMVDAPIT